MQLTLPALPASEESAYALFSLAWRARRSGSVVVLVSVLIRRILSLSQESSAAEHQLANRRDDAWEILTDVNVFEAKDNDPRADNNRSRSASSFAL